MTVRMSTVRMVELARMGSILTNVNVKLDLMGTCVRPTWSRNYLYEQWNLQGWNF